MTTDTDWLSEMIENPANPALHELAETLVGLAIDAHDMPRARALDKALYQLDSGVQPRRTYGGWLVPSRTDAAQVYRVRVHEDERACTCEAGMAGRLCWHVAAVELLEGQR